MSKKETTSGRLKGEEVGGLDIGRLIASHFTQGQYLRVTVEAAPDPKERVARSIAVMIAASLMDPEFYSPDDVNELANVIAPLIHIDILCFPEPWNQESRWGLVVEDFDHLECDALDAY